MIEKTREHRISAWVDAIAQDIRYTFRGMRKSPAFTLTVLLTLSLCIGANTAVFSIVDSALLRPLSYHDANRLVAVHENIPPVGLAPVNGAHFTTWRRATSSFEHMALLGGITMNFTGAGEPERLPGARVSPALFSILRVRAQLGRTLVDADDVPGNDAVVVLSNELWRRRFNADPRVIGQTVTLDDRLYEIVGVLPPDFHFPKLANLYPTNIDEARPEIWKPMGLRFDESKPSPSFACIARLKPGVSLPQALADLSAAQSQVAASNPGPRQDLRAAIVPLQDQVASRARTGLELLLAAVGAVLLIGCINITNLLLARNAVRYRETAVRCALGASRWRLVRQMLTESLVLSGLGGAIGVALAYLAIRIVQGSAPADVPRLDEVRLDGRVLLFTVFLSSLAGLIVGVFPAWRFGLVDLQDAMRARGSTSTAGAGRLQSLLIGLEVCLCVMCLCAGGLLLHSFAKLMTVDTGFETRGLMTVELNLPGYRYSTVEKKAVFLDTLLERLASLPGVTSVGVSDKLPLTGEGGGSVLRTDGPKPFGLGYSRMVNPDYFRTMSIPLLAGRTFTEADRGRHVAVVSALTAKHFWAGEDPIGKRLRLGLATSPPIEVIGVTADIRGVSLTKNPAPTLYQPYWQNFSGQASLIVKTATDPVAASPAIRGAINGIDPELPISAFRTMDETVLESVAQRQFQMRVVLLFAAAALLLASLGIYGVVSYAVARRTNEIGIRTALGAPARRIHWMVLRQGAAPVVIGLAAGLIASLGLGRLIRSLVFGVTTSDPMTLSTVAILLMTAAVAAISIPARRATRIDPLVALRNE
jgi:putative ABC transport system permease protein